jgi:two-component system response regulator BaeR
MDEQTSSTPEHLAFIIEDDEDQAYVFAKALDMAGYSTETIPDGTIAEQRINDAEPELVVLDLHLPGTKGDKLLRQIRSDARLGDTRVLVVTADAALAESLEDEATLVLLKPISFAQLCVLAARFIDD